MDYLQYLFSKLIYGNYLGAGFKPYYKWITFNTYVNKLSDILFV